MLAALAVLGALLLDRSAAARAEQHWRARVSAQLQLAKHPRSQAVGFLLTVEQILGQSGDPLTLRRLLDMLPELPLHGSVNEGQYVRLAAGLNAAAYLGKRRKVGSEFAPDGGAPPHALHPYMVDKLICRAILPGSPLREICRVVAQLHDVIEDKVQVTARDSAQHANSVRFVDPARVHAEEPEERALEATAIARDGLNELFGRLSEQLSGGRGIGDLVALVSHPLVPDDAQFDFAGLDVQNGGLKAMKKAALAVAQVLREPEVGWIAAAVKIADATETLEQNYTLLGSAKETGLVVVDGESWRKRLDQIAWQLARRRYLVDTFSRRFQLPPQLLADFESEWQHQTARFYSLDPQLEAMVHDRVDQTRFFAQHNRSQIDRELKAYSDKLLGWSRAHVAIPRVFARY